MNCFYFVRTTHYNILARRNECPFHWRALLASYWRMHPSNRGPTIGLGVQCSYLHARSHHRCQMHCGYCQSFDATHPQNSTVPAEPLGSSLLVSTKNDDDDNMPVEEEQTMAVSKSNAKHQNDRDVETPTTTNDSQMKKLGRAPKRPLVPKNDDGDRPVKEEKETTLSKSNEPLFEEENKLTKSSDRPKTIPTRSASLIANQSTDRT